MTDAGQCIAGSTMMTIIARNGTDLGIRVSGLGDEWFTNPVGQPDGLYFTGFTAEDASGISVIEPSRKRQVSAINYCDAFTVLAVGVALALILVTPLPNKKMVELEKAREAEQRADLREPKKTKGV